MKSEIKSIFDLDWKPRVLIEASAGTGKTYTITGLFIRLLIEKKLDISQILVMTFTRKATSELSGRIFRQLRNCLRVLEEGPEKENDVFLNEFYEMVQNRSDTINILREAILNFDENQVTTIHGFCQKVLKEEALLTGSPLDVEIAQNDDLLDQAVEDYWRLFMDRYSQKDTGRYLISTLMKLANSPSELKKLIQPLISKPYAEIEGVMPVGDIGSYLEEVIQLRKEMVQVWNEEQFEILEVLSKCDISRFQQYLDSRLNKLVSFLEDEEFSQDSPESLYYFTSDYLYDESNLPKSRKAEPTIPHHFFEICNDYHELIRDIDQIKTGLIVEAFQEIDRIRKKSSVNSGSVTYDDLLTNLLEALEEPGRGDSLAKELLNKYPFALVDEFQDTDPVQYGILDAIYPLDSKECGLLMIGDPKQAIYAFRGADVYTYFGARESSAENLYTLQNNYRSTPRLIEAVNHLFDHDLQSFIDDNVEYFKSKSGKKDIADEFVLDGESGGLFIVTARSGVDSNKNDPKDFAFQQTVFEIAQLLDLAEEGKATIKGRPLQAGDIAVLVYGHKDAFEIKQMLKRIGVDSVTQSRQQVFETFEAHRLELLMAAVLDPLNRTDLNNALTTGFFGIGLSGLYELKEDEKKRQSLIDELQVLSEIWTNDGFYPMYSSLLARDNRLAELSLLNDAERVLTNLSQLADICSKAEIEGGLDPHSLYSWFRKEKADPGEDDERTLLLESDQNLVKISTVHNSKGLQFPVVFCPSLWEGRDRVTDKIIPYHQENTRNVVLNIDQQSNEQRKKAEDQFLLESVAEEARKAYVAMTRAKYACNLFWASHTSSVCSGLGAILLGKDQVEKAVRDNGKVSNKGDITDKIFLERLKELAEESSGTIDLKILEDADVRIAKVKKAGRITENLQYTPYSGRKELQVQRKLGSFSSLVHHKSEPHQPDYDQVMENYLGLFDKAEEESRALNIFTFPRGATAGTAIHKLFEHDDFDFTEVSETDYSGMIEEVLDLYRISPKWVPAAQQMIREVTASHIPGVNLAKVEENDQLREMEFHFSASETSADRLFRIIRDGELPSPQFQFGKHFMTGFIDLIVRQNGIYTILDYKSNHLGDSLADYTPDRLKQEVEEAGYDLQYHLYTLALKKYLEKRIPGFDYEKQFGGVAYLFVRGMRKGSQNGIWFHKPELKTINNLEKELYSGSLTRSS
ncbi:MAG: exodeoxyribonuclease V subunit beta [Balneolaceae bacterium]|nr:exodeoxyribonuclease V subunit beta [Balneolaceae bacterium]